MSSRTDSDDVSSTAEEDDHEEKITRAQSQPLKKKPRVLAPLDLAPSVTTTEKQRKEVHSSQQKIIILLDQASLETVKNRRGLFELLNCDDHRDLCKKKLKRDPKDFRPDICHQELLSILDSPLNKAGCLQVYIRTTQNVLIEVHPSIRIPRTFKRFSGLIVQLLHKMKIKAGTTSTNLMKVIKNPFSQYLPAGTHVYGMSCQGTLYSPMSLANTLVPSDRFAVSPPTCFIVGAMATGHVSTEDHPYIEKMISISEYPLSGAAALSRILGGIEHHWGII